MIRMPRNMMAGFLAAGLSVGAAFAEGMHQVNAPDGSSAILVPEDWRCAGGQRGMIDIAGPDGDGAFGLWAPIITPEAMHRLCDPYGLPVDESKCAPYCTAEQFVQYGFPRVAATLGVQVTGVEISAEVNLGWPGMDSKMIGFTCMRNGVPMSYFMVIATWVVSQDEWAFYESFVGVRSDKMQASWPWITQTFASFQVSQAEYARRWREVQDNMNKITQIVQDVTVNRARAQDKASQAWDDYIRGVWTYTNGDTGETQKMTPDEARKKNDEAGRRLYKLPNE